MHPHEFHQSTALSKAKTLLSVPDQLALSILWFALNFQNAALLPIVIPTQILVFTGFGQVGNAQQAALLGWLSALGSVVALLVQPTIGALSDRTPGMLGRRRPYIIVAAFLLLLGAFQLATARAIAAFAIGFFVFQIASSACTAAYQSLLPDRVPREQRGTASGYMGLMTIMGNVVSLALAGILLSSVTLTSISSVAIERGANIFYALTGFVLLVSVVITITRVPDVPLTQAKAPAAPTGVRLRFTYMWIDPWRHQNFTWVFLTRAFVMLGLTLFLTFIEYYFANVAHVTNFIQATATLAVLALLGAVCSAFLLGILSDRVGRVPLVLLASICMASAATAFLVLPAGAPLWPLGLLFGLGYGAYTSVDWALAVDVLPSASDAGKDMGIWSTATTLPAIVAPLLGSIVLTFASRFGTTAAGYRLVFALAAIFLILGALCVRFVQENRSPSPAVLPAPSQPASPRRRVAPGWRLAGGTRAGQARGFLRFWPFWERITLLVHPTTPIPHATASIFEVQFIRWPGRPITLPDGTRVAKGDRVVELHLNNRMLASIMTHTNSRPLLLHRMEDDLRAFAAWSKTPQFPPEIRAVYGFTLLSRAAPRLGFTTRARPHTMRHWLDRLFIMGLLALYSPQGTERLQQGTTYRSYPEEVWMSLHELLRRYDTPEQQPSDNANPSPRPE